MTRHSPDFQGAPFCGTISCRYSYSIGAIGLAAHTRIADQPNPGQDASGRQSATSSDVDLCQARNCRSARGDNYTGIVSDSGGFYQHPRDDQGYSTCATRRCRIIFWLSSANRKGFSFTTSPIRRACSRVNQVPTEITLVA